MGAAFCMALIREGERRCRFAPPARDQSLSGVRTQYTRRAKLGSARAIGASVTVLQVTKQSER
ncbi:hypothetical protein B5X24_HaOG214232, partial [Helicoverpa armigera]